MKKSGGFFGSLFAGRNEAAAPRREQLPPLPSGIPYQKGDLIGGKYEVHGVLGKGGFGIVYLVYSLRTKDVYAFKTFRDEYLANAQIRERFRKEAHVWVDLERHPYLLRASFVDEIAGRLYIATDYIAPNEEGLNSLEVYLERRPPDLAQTLCWAIQFCHGMEYAYSKGIRCHRDIKPANILIAQDKTVKIADFGLAGILAPTESVGETGHPYQPGLTMAGISFGTPTHMPPEQFTDAASCDEKSDIYSFGVVLYQMAVGGRLPFLAAPPKNDLRDEQMRFWWEMHELHRAAPIPKLDSPLHAVIQRCLAKESNRRYRSFAELRGELETLLHRETGEVFQPVKPEEFAAWEWVNKGVSLHNLGRREEAIRCYDRALEIDPRFANAWNNKALAEEKSGKTKAAIETWRKYLKVAREMPSQREWIPQAEERLRKLLKR